MIYSRFFKRPVDLLLSGVAVIFLLPIMAIIAAGIRLDSPGPALFRQERVGHNRRQFKILKFRTMVSNAEEIGGFRTATDDPRITRFGHWLRRTSLDELPQLINVCVGDMSLIGPRPDTPKQVGDYAPWQWELRHRVRPGITGLAQATLRSAATPKQRRDLDLRYVEEISFLLDLRILLMTCRQVLTKGGN